MGRLWIGFIMVALAGCSGPAKAPPAWVQMDIIASEDINPDGEGRPSPVVIKVYFLKHSGRFEAEDFFRLFRQEKEVLGDDLVAVEELRMAPRTHRSLIRKVDEEARWLGVVAAFRDIDHALWRQWVAIPPHRTTRVKIMLAPLAIDIEVLP